MTECFPQYTTWSIPIEKSPLVSLYGRHTGMMVFRLRHLFNGLSSRTTWVSRHEKDKPFWVLMKQEMLVWQWHQLDHFKSFVPHSRQITTPAPRHSFFTGRMFFLMPNQLCRSTEGNVLSLIIHQKRSAVGLPWTIWDSLQGMSPSVIDTSTTLGQGLVLKAFQEKYLEIYNETR